MYRPDKRAELLEIQYGGLPAEQLIPKVTRDLYPGRTAVVTSFGTESAVLLNLVARVNTAIPVLFLDTGQHFAETLAYRDHLTTHLELSDVRNVKPLPYQLRAADADGTLWSRDPDYCCHLRKVLPLEEALAEFDCWISGRKRHHGAERESVRTFEIVAGRLQVNPLIHWSRAEIDFAFDAQRLPRHPLSRTASFTTYTGFEFRERHQRRLAELYRKLDTRGCLLMLTNSATPLIRRLYDGFRIETTLAARAISCKGKGRGKVEELVVINY